MWGVRSSQDSPFYSYFGLSRFLGKGLFQLKKVRDQRPDNLFNRSRISRILGLLPLAIGFCVFCRRGRSFNAMSSFFTAIVIGRFLEMADVHQDPREENKWMIFHWPKFGRSFPSAVTLLNCNATGLWLLIYIFKKYEKPNFKGSSIRYVFGWNT